MITEVRDTITRHRMLSKGDTVVVSVSGGVDSTVLLHLFVRLKDEYSLKLVVCHLNHNLRGKESERDLKFVKALAGKLGLKFEGKTLKKGELEKEASGLSLQEAAREKRYAFLEETARKHGAKKIALGHTEDDLAETVLMRLLKGSSLKGLSGIPPVRLPFIRPLIGVSRGEVEGFARKEGIPHVLDSSNATDKYLRNDVRLNLIPYLKKNYNPNIIETLSRTAAALRMDDDCLEKEARRLLPEVVIDRKKGAVALDRGKLLSLHEALRVRVFLLSLDAVGKRADISSAHIKAFLDIIKSRKPGASADLPGVKLTREYERLIVSRRPKGEAFAFREVLKVPGITEIKGAGVFKASLLKKVPVKFAADGKTAYFDYGEVKGPVTVRQMTPGDRIVPFGMKGSKKLKEIFIEKKVPKAKRANIPVLSSGGVILWAAGIKQSELCKVKKTTEAVLKIEFSGGGQLF